MGVVAHFLKEEILLVLVVVAVVGLVAAEELEAALGFTAAELELLELLVLEFVAVVGLATVASVVVVGLATSGFTVAVVVAGAGVERVNRPFTLEARPLSPPFTADAACAGAALPAS
jgi:hypothetical protein